MSNSKKDEICEEVIFDDNSRAAEIYGPNNLHLSLIEQALNVTMRNRGNELTICGDGADVQKTQAVLRQLWEQQDAGLTIDKQEIATALRFLQKERPKGDMGLVFRTKKENNFASYPDAGTIYAKFKRK